MEAAGTGSQRVSTLELFFDLVFVLALAAMPLGAEQSAAAQIAVLVTLLFLTIFFSDRTRRDAAPTTG